jgi:hypothetical protein
MTVHPRCSPTAYAPPIINPYCRRVGQIRIFARILVHLFIIYFCWLQLATGDMVRSASPAYCLLRPPNRVV